MVEKKIISTLFAQLYGNKFEYLDNLDWKYNWLNVIKKKIED